jgi:hypothetical protein
LKSHRYHPARNKAWGDRCAYQERVDTPFCRALPGSQIHKGDFLPVGSAGVVRCPFDPCGKTVTVRSTQPRPTIEQHEIAEWAGAPAGMNCPASLMSHPLTPDEERALYEQSQSLAEQIGRDMAREHNDQRYYPLVSPLAESQTLRNQGRMGREPEPDSEDWVLGGRADEDVFPAQETVTGVVPAGVGQYPMGRGSGMPTIQESADMARVAIDKGEEALTYLKRVNDLLAEGRRIVSELQGDSTASTLMDWMTMLNQAHETTIIAKNTVPLASEYGNRFINNLLG